MRTDITIDKKQVNCPNASHLGFDKYKAQVGDLLLFNENGREVTGRMIGRIAYAPVGESHLKGYIVAVCLNTELSHTFERWVNPVDVTRVQPLENEYINRRAVVDWFLSDEMTRASIEDVRRSTTDGWSTLAKYRANQERNAKDQAEFKVRHANCDSEPCDFCCKFHLKVS